MADIGTEKRTMGIIVNKFEVDDMTHKCTKYERATPMMVTCRWWVSESAIKILRDKADHENIACRMGPRSEFRHEMKNYISR